MSGGGYTRSIRNGSNYLPPNADPETGYEETIPGFVEDNGQGYQGSGQLTHSSSKSPIQVFARDALDAGKRATVAFQVANDPSVRRVMVAENPNPTDVEVNGTTLEYDELWDGVKWSSIHGGNTYKDSLEIQDFAGRRAEEGNIFERSFLTRPSAGCRIEQRSDGIHTIRNRDNRSMFVTRNLVGWDSNGSEFEPNLPCESVLSDVGGGWQRLTYRADITNAVGDGVLDPTTIIDESSGGYEDGAIYQTANHFNYGGATSSNVNPTAGNIRRALWKLDPSVLPEGSISAGRWIIRAGDTSGWASAGDVVNCHELLKSYNMGTGAGVAATNNVDWTHTDHDASATWSNVGADHAGVDRAVTAFLVIDVSLWTAPGFQTFSLPVAMLNALRAQTAYTNGWVGRGVWAPTNNWVTNNIDHPNAGLRPSVEVDWVAAYYYNHIVRGAF